MGSLSFLSRRNHPVSLGMETETPARVRAKRVSLGLIAEFIPDNAPQCLEAVFPGNLLAFLVGAAGVGDRDFVDAPLVPGDLCRDLRFESKPVRFDLDSCEYFSPTHLVAGLHLPQLHVSEDVREQRQHPVRNVVADLLHALWPAQKS